MKIIIIRHAETKGYKQKLVKGWLDVPLTIKGIRQAKRLANILKNEDIDQIYSSDSIRCRETAKEIIKYHPELRIHLTKVLREQHKTIFEGKPIHFWHSAIQKSGLPWEKYRPPNGETMDEVQKRIVLFYKRLLTKYDQETIVLIASGGPIVSLILYLLKKPFSEDKKYQPDFTAITVINASPSGKAAINRLK